jgi:hypothetical protein
MIFGQLPLEAAMSASHRCNPPQEGWSIYFALASESNPAIPLSTGDLHA